MGNQPKSANIAFWLSAAIVFASGMAGGAYLIMHGHWFWGGLVILAVIGMRVKG